MLKYLKMALAAAAVTVSAQSAQAQRAPTGDWEYAVNVYFWGAGMDVTTGAGNGISLAFSDIWENLDFALMGSFLARRDDLAFFIDAVYLDLSGQGTANVGPGPGPGVDVTANIGLTGFITTFGAGRNFYGSNDQVSTGFVAARGLFLDTSISTSAGNFGEDGNKWDAVAGFRGRTRLSDQWGLTYYVDAGLGESDFTYQGIVTFNYQLESWDLSIGYRHMHWDFGSGGLLSDLTVAGPIAGAVYRF